MVETEKRKGGGAKMSRSETVTVRLDPKLRYLAELASRKQRRTLSSYIEWAVEASLKNVNLYEGTGYNGDHNVTVDEEANQLWDVDDAERFIKLAIYYPSLLTHEEQERWKMLMDSQILDPGRSRDANGRTQWETATLEDVVYPVIRNYWQQLIEAHAGGVQTQKRWVEVTRGDVKAGVIYSAADLKQSRLKNTPGVDGMVEKVQY